MTELGDIHYADFHDEVRRRVMVASSARFHRTSGRVLVVPELIATGPHPSYPWRVEAMGTWFAVDRLTTLAAESLLQPVGTAPMVAVERLRRAIRNMT
jgi:hypothetical protein